MQCSGMCSGLCRCCVHYLCAQVGSQPSSRLEPEFVFCCAVLNSRAMVQVIISGIGLCDQLANALAARLKDSVGSLLSYFPDVEAHSQGKVVTVLFCNDGKETEPGTKTPITPQLLNQHRNTFERLIRRVNSERSRRDGRPRAHVAVELVQVSFWDPAPEFFRHLEGGDIFYMAGFTNQVAAVQQIYLEANADLRLKRRRVANMVVTEGMRCWGVCGSAVSFGKNMTLPTRTSMTPEDGYEMFNILGPKGNVDYCYVQQDMPSTTDLDKFEITMGTLACMCSGPKVPFGYLAEAFPIHKKWKWKNFAEVQTKKLQNQAATLGTTAQGGVISSYQTDSGQIWCLNWWSGEAGRVLCGFDGCYVYWCPGKYTRWELCCCEDGSCSMMIEDAHHLRSRCPWTGHAAG